MNDNNNENGLNLDKHSKKGAVNWIKSILLNIDDHNKFAKYYNSVIDFDNDVQLTLKKFELNYSDLKVNNKKLSEQSYHSMLAKRSVPEAQKLIPLIRRKNIKNIDIDLFERLEKLYSFTLADMFNEFQSSKSFIKSKDFEHLRIIYYYNRAMALASKIKHQFDYINKLYSLEPNHSIFENIPECPSLQNKVINDYVSSIEKSGMDKSFFPFFNYKRANGESFEIRYLAELSKAKARNPKINGQWHPVRDLDHDIKVKYLLLYIKLMKRQGSEIKYYQAFQTYRLKFRIVETNLGLNEREIATRLYTPASNAFRRIFIDMENNPKKYIKDNSFSANYDMLAETISTTSRIKGFVEKTYNLESLQKLKLAAKAS